MCVGAAPCLVNKSTPPTHLGSVHPPTHLPTSTSHPSPITRNVHYGLAVSRSSLSTTYEAAQYVTPGHDTPPRHLAGRWKKMAAGRPVVTQVKCHYAAFRGITHTSRIRAVTGEVRRIMAATVSYRNGHGRSRTWRIVDITTINGTTVK